MTGHTPGPWTWSHIDGDRRNPLWVLQSPARDVILTIKHLEFGPTTNPEANRPLIAAAPEMYEALQRALSDWLIADHDPVGDLIRAAIAKVEAQP